MGDEGSSVTDGGLSASAGQVYRASLTEQVISTLGTAHPSAWLIWALVLVTSFQATALSTLIAASLLPDSAYLSLLPPAISYITAQRMDDFFGPQAQLALFVAASVWTVGMLVFLVILMQHGGSAGKEALFASRKPVKGATGVSADPTRFIAASVWKILALLSGSVLLTPFMGAFFRMIVCQEAPSDADRASFPHLGSYVAESFGGADQCFQGVHLALVLISILLAVGLMLVASVYWMLLVTHTLQDPFPFGGVTPTYTLLMNTEDVVFASLACSVFMDTFPQSLTVGIMAAKFATLTYPFIFRSDAMTFAAQDGMAARFFAAMWPILCALLGTLFPAAEIGPLVLFGLPIVALGGFFVSQARRAAVLAAPLDKLRSEAAVGVWAQYRYMIAARRGAGLAYWGLAMLDASGALQTDEDREASRRGARRQQHGTGAAASSEKSSLLGKARSAGGTTLSSTLGSRAGGGTVLSSAAGSVFNGVLPGDGAEAGAEFDDETHLETGEGEDELGGDQKQYTLDEAAGGWLGSAAFYRANALTAAPRRRSYLQEAEQAYNTLLGKHPSSYMAALRGAMFYATSHVRASAYMELRLLSQAWRLSEGGSGTPGLNVAVHIIHRRLYLQHTGSAASSAAVSGARRLLFERHLAGARAAEVAGYRVAASVWAELARAPPDLGALHSLAIAFRKHRSGAEYHFRRMLALNGNSPEVHRAFAAFLSEQLHDDDEAAEHLSKAEKLEAIVQASSHAKVARFEMLSAPSSGGTSMDAGLSIALSAGSGGTSMDDSIGVLLLSGGSLDAGAVLDANGAACRLFGAARSELIGIAVTRLLPPPLGHLTRAAVHKLASRVDPFLYRWTHLLVMRLSGEIVPVTLMLQEAPPAATGPPEPRFSVLVRPIKLTGSSSIAVVAIEGEGGTQDGSTVFSATMQVGSRRSSSASGGGGRTPNTPAAGPSHHFNHGAPPQFNLDGGQTWTLGGGGHGGASGRIASMVSTGGVLSPPPTSEQFFAGSARGLSSARDMSGHASPIHSGLTGLNPLAAGGAGGGSARSADGAANGTNDSAKHLGSATWAAGTASMHALLGLDVGEMAGRMQHVQVWMPHIMRKLRARRLRRSAHRFALAMVTGLGTGYVEHEHLHGGFMSQAGTTQSAESIQEQSFVLDGARIRLRSAELVRLLQSTGEDGTDQVTDDALSDDVRVTVQALPAILPDGTIADVQHEKHTVYAIVTLSSLSGGVVDSSGGYDLNALSDLDDSNSESSLDDSGGGMGGDRSASVPQGGSPKHKGGGRPAASSLTAEMLKSAEGHDPAFGGRGRSHSPTGSGMRRASQESTGAAISGGGGRSPAERPAGIAAAGRMRSDSVDVMADGGAGGGGTGTGRPPARPKQQGGTSAKPRHVGSWSTPSAAQDSAGAGTPPPRRAGGVDAGDSALRSAPLIAVDSKAAPVTSSASMSDRVLSSDSEMGVLAVSSGDSSAAARDGGSVIARKGGLKSSSASKYAAGPGGPTVDTASAKAHDSDDTRVASSDSWDVRGSSDGASPFAPGTQRRRSSAAGGPPVRFVSRRGSAASYSGSPARAGNSAGSYAGDAASTAGSSVWSGATHGSQLKRITVKALQNKTRLLRDVLDSQSAGDLAPVRLTQRIFVVWTVALVLFCFVGGISYWLSFQDLMLKHTESLWRGGERMRYMLQTRSLLVSAGEFSRWGVASSPFNVYVQDVAVIKEYLATLDESQLFDARELVDFSPQRGDQVTAFTRADSVHTVSFFTLELDGLTAYGDLYAAFVAGLVGEVSAAGAGVRINSREERNAIFDDVVLGLLGGGDDDAGTTEQHQAGTVVTSPMSVTQAGQLIQVELGVFVNGSANSSSFLVSGSQPAATAYVFNTATTVLDAYNATILAKAEDAEAFFNYMWLQDVGVLLAAMLAPSLFMLARSSFTATDLHNLRFEPLATMLFLPQEQIKELSNKALEQFRAALGREDTEGEGGGNDGGGGDGSDGRADSLMSNKSYSKSLTPTYKRGTGASSPMRGGGRWSRDKNLHAARFHTDGGRFFTKAFAVISTPLLAVVLYITVVFALESSLLQALSEQSQRMYTAQQLAVHSSLYRSSVEDAMFSVGAAREAAVDLARQRALQSRYYMNLLLHGGDVSLFEQQAANWVQGPSISRAELGESDANLLELDACTNIALLTGEDAQQGSLGTLAKQHASGCGTFSGRLFTHGVEQALYRYLADGSIILSVLTGPSVNTTMPQLLDPASAHSVNSSSWSPDLAGMLHAMTKDWVTLEEAHLRHSLGRLSAVVHDRGVTELEGHRIAFHIANIVCAVVIPLFIAGLLWPMVSYLGDSLLAARGLLLLVSPTAVHQVPEMKRLVVSLLKEYTQARKYTKWWKDHDVAVGRSAKHARGGAKRAGASGITSASLYSDGVYSAQEE